MTHVLFCEFCEISKNTFSYRTSPVAVSVHQPIFCWCFPLFQCFPVFCSTEAVIWRCSIKSALQNFAEFTGKHLCKSLFWQCCRQRPATLLKNRLQHWCFPVGFTKFYKTSFLQKISTRQLLAVTDTRLRWKERKHWWKMHNRQRCIQNPVKHLRQNFWRTY